MKWIVGCLCLTLVAACDSSPFGANFALAPSTGGSATRLAFVVQPTTTGVAATMTPAVQVAVVNEAGAVVSSSRNITINLTPGFGTPGAQLAGSLVQAAVGGVATFADLTIDRPGTGYKLTAVAPGLSNGTSAGFNVTP